VERPKRRRLTSSEVPEAGVLSDGISIKDSPESLPEWWEKRKTGLGRTYYVDHITRTTAWDLPSSGSAVVLPEWWEWRQNNLGRTYYVNHKTRTTTWVPPPVTTYDDIQRGVVEYVQSAEKYEVRLNRDPMTQF
jgi:hypothetical protein